MTYVGGAVLVMSPSPGRFFQNTVGGIAPWRMGISTGQPGWLEKQRDHLWYEKEGYGKMTCSEWDSFSRKYERIVEQVTPDLRPEVGSKEENQQKLIVGTGDGRAQRKKMLEETPGP